MRFAMTRHGMPMSVRSGGPEGQTVSLSSGGLWPWDGRPIRGAGGYRSFLSSQLVASVIASATSFLFHSKPRRARNLLLLASKLQSLRWSAAWKGERFPWQAAHRFALSFSKPV